MIILLYLQMHGDLLYSWFKFSIYRMRVEAVRAYGSVDRFNQKP